MVVQLITPNLEISEKAGMCLSYARRAFGAPVVEKTAWQGWENAKGRHADRNFPAGAAVPVWFDWWGQLPGDQQKYQYGHVAVRAADGRIWSSPLSGTGRAWFNSVDDLVRAFGGGMRYVGWSRDISGKEVIDLEEEMAKPTAQDVSNIVGEIWGVPANANNIRDYVELEWPQFVYHVLGNSTPWMDRKNYLTNIEGQNRSLSLQLEDALESLRKMPEDTSGAEKKLQAIKDALGIRAI